MMSPGGQFFDEFIDDYFSECDEHLGTVRRVLLEIEAAPGAALGPPQLHEFARALHTLKGLSGMVGLAAAEEIAHAMEDAVRLFESIKSAPPELVEALFVGARLLEDAIESKRSRTAAASPGPYVDRVHDVIRMIGARGTTQLMVGTPSGLTRATDGIDAPSARVYRFEFVPSQGLAARGVGVESVRRRLALIGDVTMTTPRVRANGAVAFEFTVSVAAGKLPDEAWRTDGLSWELLPDSDGTASVGVVVREATRAANVASTTPSNVVRVDLSRLDELMRMVGELVVSRARLGESVANAAGGLSSTVWENLNEMNAVIERQIRTIREGVMRIRLVPIGEVFERMRFAMRDIARETGKEILLEVSGQDIEIDKLVVDRMLEPLLHLVRNAASHGIEPRDQREAMGKRAEGTISLRARAAGDRILLEVEDDGAGIDIERVTDRARTLGLSPGTDALSLDVVLDIICAPGLSTRDVADMASGRGIGMAVVQSTVRRSGSRYAIHDRAPTHVDDHRRIARRSRRSGDGDSAERAS
jgi:two-component system chemotaxis sensor kinase CheA